MSRAFVNEELAGSRPEPPVERPVSDRPNYVTARGLQQLQQRVTRLLAEVAAAQGLEDGDAQQLAELERDLHYYQQRLQAAVQVMPAVSRDMVQIGSRVAYATPDGHEHEVQIVGEDEADPAGGLVSWESPLGQALIGAAPGEEVRWVRPAGDLLIEVLEIIPEPH